MYLKDLAKLVISYKTPFEMTKYDFCNYETQFMLHSFRNWAIDEILNDILDGMCYEECRMKVELPIDAIDYMERWRNVMDEFACIAKTSEANAMFSVAYDLCVEILDDIIVLEREESK